MRGVKLYKFSVNDRANTQILIKCRILSLSDISNIFCFEKVLSMESLLSQLVQLDFYISLW